MVWKVVEKVVGRNTVELTVLAAQIDIPAVSNQQERDAHVSATVALLQQQLRQRPADLLVLPELSTIDYSRESFARLSELAESLDGPSVSTYQELAQQHAVMVFVGLPIHTDAGFHISQVVIDATGEVLGCYHKMHMAHYGASMEKDYFTRGTQLLVVDCQGFRLAPMICYDIRFPEMARALALAHDVDILLHSGAYYRDESFATWHPFVITRAMENQVYVLSLNRAGEHYGASVFAPPWIDDEHPMIRLHEHREAFGYVTVNRQIIEQVRHQYTFLQDRQSRYVV